MASNQQQLQCGYFLREAAALQRTNLDGTRHLTRIAFPTARCPDGTPLTVVTTSVAGGCGPVLRLSATITRNGLYETLAHEDGWVAPDPKRLYRFPAIAPAPTLLIYADLLDDIGDHLFLLRGCPADVVRPDIGARLDAVGLLDEVTAVVEVTAVGVTHRVRIPLDSGFPLDVVPLGIADRLMAVEPTADEDPACDWTYPVGDI